MRASDEHVSPAADERERWTPGARSASPWQFLHACRKRTRASDGHLSPAASGHGNSGCALHAGIGQASEDDKCSRVAAFDRYASRAAFDRDASRAAFDRYASRSAAIGVSRKTSRPVARPMITASAVMASATTTTGATAGE